MADIIELRVADSPDHHSVTTSKPESLDLSVSPVSEVAIVETDRDRRRRAAKARWRFAERLNAGPFPITPDWQDTIDNYKSLKAERVTR